MSASAASVPYGLVFSSSTSDTRSSGSKAAANAASRLGATACHLVDRAASRLKKMKHGVLTQARLTNEMLRRGGFRYHVVLVTLTYAPGNHWNGRHVSHFLKCAREWHRRNGKRMHYVWTAEMQERGAVHYHVVMWLPSGYWLPKPDKRGWWSHGSSNVTPATGSVSYVAKYASKGLEGPSFPKGVRIHGAGGLDHLGKQEARFWRAPSEAREFFGGPHADVRPITGGRVDALTGLFWKSPWRLILVEGKQHMFRIEGGETPCTRQP